MSVKWGYTLSSEEQPPAALVRGAAEAEAGFDFCSISDHFHPWVQAQGHSPFVWSVLGAIAAGTDRLGVLTGVTCPTMRIHPAVVAHAAATTSLLFGDRFSLGVGSGEALNEHILGHRWPTPEVRLAMLEEAVTVIREMWTGDTVDWKGDYFKVENARLFDAPQRSIPIIVSGFGTDAAELAGRSATACSATAPAPNSSTPTAAPGAPAPGMRRSTSATAPTRTRAPRPCSTIWPNHAIPGQLAQDLPTWTHFEQVARLVSIDEAAKGVPWARHRRHRRAGRPLRRRGLRPPLLPPDRPGP